jgi:cell wall-associated NlpC family hydrolase
MAWRSYSGLNLRQRAKARELGLKAARLGLARAPSLHYTQGARRWEGIADHLKAWKGQCPHYADCSAFATWVLWNGLDHYGLKDIVNGANWQGGYTGTQLAHGRVVTRGKKPLDLVLYGRPGTTGEHVAVYVGNGKVISHGSEKGPYLLPWNYRPDVIETRRYI